MPPVPRQRPFTDAALDLLLGGRCVGCERPGRIWCEVCAAGTPCRPRRIAGPDVVTWAAAPYDGAVRRLVVGHKERRLVRLRPVLADLLALAVAALVSSRHATGSVLLVPVPSRAGVTRARGYAPTEAITSAAAATLRHSGLDVTARALLRVRRGVVDQSGLTADERRLNTRHGLAVRPGALAGWARTGRSAHVVICDDIVTTGSTLDEAARALAAVGLTALGAGVVAATPRRRPGPFGDTG